MAFLIRTIDHTAAGRAIVRSRELAKATLTIGRDAACDIHLPDLAVEQLHARIEPAGEGVLHVVAQGSREFSADGHAATSATVHPRDGAELGFGSYRLAITQDSEGPVTISITHAADRTGERADAVQGFALASALPGKRALAWVAAVAILVLFLAVPIYSSLTRAPVEPKIDRPGQVALDASWSTGPLSKAHHALEGQCEACHVRPFEAVRDETCLTCHKTTGNHARRDRLAVARGPDPLGEALLWQVAHQFGKPGPGACTDCHTEHEGAGAMPPPAQQFCASCHETLDRRLTDSVLGNAGDFGELHPQFEPAVLLAPASTPTRISLDKHPREWTGLRFPHALHLDPKGGVARMAGTLSATKGYGESLVCGDCHRPERDGVTFQPIEMERDCEACHSLVYDQVGSTFRKLTHGDVAQMRADLVAMDRAPRLPIVTGRRRPGEFGEGGRYRIDFGRPGLGSYVAIDRALAPDGVCGECHVPTTSNGQPDVMPVKLSERYFLHGWFDHAAHREEKCSTCHLAGQSRSSADLLLPGIATCRTCHQGESASRAEVPSGCAMCHAYHPPSGQVAVRPPPRRRE